MNRIIKPIHKVLISSILSFFSLLICLTDLQAQEKPADFLKSLESNLGIENVQFSQYSFDDLQDSQVVARVDGDVILFSDVQSAIKPQLQMLKAKAPKDQYNEIAWKLMAQQLQQHIERYILINEFKSKLPDPRVYPHVRSQAKNDFKRHMVSVAVRNGMRTQDGKNPTFNDVKTRLQQDGMDIAALERTFIDNIISQQYLRQSIQTKFTKPTREELYQYYQSHTEDFATENGVIWRHIQVDKTENPAVSYQKIAKAREAIVAGKPFAEVAKKTSEGPTATDGGLWSLTSKGSYADEQVDKILFEIPLNQLSSIIEGDRSFHLVMVEKRSDGSPKPFAEVQQQIQVLIHNEQSKELREKALAKFKSNHFVETIFDSMVARSTDMRK